MNDLDEYQDVVTRVRSGLSDIRHRELRPDANPVDNARSPARRRIPLRPERRTPPSRFGGPVVAAASGLVVLLLAFIPFALMRGGPGAEPTVGVTEDWSPSTTGPAVSVQPVMEWTSASVPDGFAVHTIVALNGRFFGLATDDLEVAADDGEEANFENPDPRTRLWVSDDGATWEAIDVDASSFGMRAGYFQEMTTVGEVYVAKVKGEPLSADGSGLGMVFSADARSWSPVEFNGPNGLIVDLAGGSEGGMALARAEDGYDAYQVWHSADGITWTLATTRRFEGISGPSLASVGGEFYLGADEWVAGDGEPVLWRSVDGSDWSSVELPSGGGSWVRTIPAGNNDAVLLSTYGVTGSQLWTAPRDGDWVEVTPSGYPDDPVLKSSDDGPIIIVDRGGIGPSGETGFHRPTALWWSLDGHQWTEISQTNAFDTEGTIGATAVNVDTLVVLQYSHPNQSASFWIGIISE